MFRMWGKLYKNNHMLADTVIEEPSDDTRTHKIFHALDEICQEFDLSKPIWLDSTVKEFQRHARARFTKDAFVEEVDFDYLENENSTMNLCSKLKNYSYNSNP